MIAAFALVVSVLSAGVAVFQTERANEISDSAFTLSQALAPSVDVYVNDVWADLALDGAETVLRVETELINTGDVHLSGCGTYLQASDAEGVPVQFWPSIVEPGGAYWDVAPGGKHLSNVSWIVSGPSQPSEDGNLGYVAVWFECKSADLTTAGRLFGVDLGTQNLIAPLGYFTADGSVNAPMSILPALDSYQRAAIVMEARGENFPLMPSPVPEFTVGSADSKR